MMSIDRDMTPFEKAKALLEEGELDQSHKLLSELIDQHRSRLERPEEDQSSEFYLDHKLLANVYNTRGHIKYLWVDFNEAIEDYTAAIVMDPSLAAAFYNRGQVHYRMGRYTQAETDLSQALNLKPDFRDAQLNLDQVHRDIASGRRFNVNQ